MFPPGVLRPPLLLLFLTGCAASGPPATPAPVGSLPAIPMVEGPLQLSVVYPAATDLIDARDSTFLFGSTGTGAASLTVDGQPVQVWPNGAWLAWVPVSADSLLDFNIIARTATDSVSLMYPVRRVRRYQPPLAPVWIDSTSASPSARAWWPVDEFLPVSVRAAAGASVRLILPGGMVVPLAPDVGPEAVSAAIRAFDRDSSNLAVAKRADRYTGVLRGRAIGPDPGPVVLGGPLADRPSRSCCCCLAEPPGRRAAEPSAADSAIIIEAIIGPDTTRARWPLRLALLDSVPMVVEFNDDTAGKGDTDSLTVGRARPGATYHWFFPTGTRAVVSGRLGDDLRVRLSREQEAWVPAADAIPLPAGTAAVRGTVASLTVTPGADRLVVRIPLSQRVPFRVEEREGELTLRLYNTLGDINWIRYGRSDAYLRDIRWLQAAGDEVTITATLRGPVWGYRTRWNRNDLLFEIRRPPEIDAHHPLAGKLIVIDPGHPPLGATGPTGLREAEANLAVALQLRELLSADGARVVMTRTADQSLDLGPRIRLADSLGADLLISVHNNALPDGVNPFTNNGASVFYNHPRSLPLAQAVQRALVRRLGVRDLGAARGDLALVRPTWMPAVLTEGLFMMLPDQEAALRHPLGQRAYALAVRDGVIEFLQDVAAGRGTGVP
jgi:N-acetylmuramoyl-L-alanine amidase